MNKQEALNCLDEKQEFLFSLRSEERRVGKECGS